jgi:hypothetical protein
MYVPRMASDVLLETIVVEVYHWFPTDYFSGVNHPYGHRIL